ncbi:MAG TPA: fused MFS/spermidine synthase [Candidatus Bathyarchaeia archaeon]|nr:fused MFS/spermidine synthase [Candidatus Bathyarchaeia archaeon]
MSFSLIARVVHRLISPVSGEIIVKEQLGRHVLYVQGIPQSGGIVREIWNKGVKALPEFEPVPNVLLLGLGGGSVIRLLKKRWPKAKILAVEIDSHVVVIARTYFGLDNLPGLKIATNDAFEVINERKEGIEDSNFDLVIVDIYLGKELPGFAEREDFIFQLKRLLTPRGVLVFNHLLDEAGKKTVDQFVATLKRIFPRIKTLHVGSNQLIFNYQ